MRLRQYIAATALLVSPTTAFAETINGDAADAFTAGATLGVNDGNGVNPPPNDGNPGGHTLKVGNVGASQTEGGRAPIIIFQLPDLGAIANPFTTASLTVGVGATDDDSEINVDLYGLSRRSATPDIDFTDDYYLGPDDTTNAVKLQDNFLTPTTPDGTNAEPVPGVTDATGSAALLAFLNSQYESGIGASQYIFLRLNVDGDMVEGGAAAVTGYNITTANDDVAELRPTITYNEPPAETADFDDDGDVDGADLLAWQRNVGTETGAQLEQGDANGDGAVNDSDLSVWSEQFGPGALTAVQAIPEPSALVLMLFAAAACRTRRPKRALPENRL